jgi:predicted PurR-regulated permease PerM
MALFATFFFVYEGDKLAEKSAVLIPREHRAAPVAPHLHQSISDSRHPRLL